ncbi:hypothetical protein [Bradyrhizobium sp. Ash2021]|uniref:hypothetical protein n=1 Tax=Bradyrhizobium sp. Ash2021 TaxID=2954771 RepID=UPI002815E8AA|nr:hypothetical protein [Bradyrhizobium sp. Ash2021]WMT71335.1 hypothetical protein NL528_24900 [Bradyrhizobium sp. Ash2021]
MPKYKLRDREDLASLLAKDPLLAKDLALLKALRRLAAAAGKTNADGDLAYYEIQLAIENLRHRFLREDRIRQAAKAMASAPPPSSSPTSAPLVTIQRLVRIKAHELGIVDRRSKTRHAAWRATLKRDFPLDEAKREVRQNTDQTPVEKRAVEIVRGAQRKAKKNFVEKEAVRLADAVLADWPPPAGLRGRPTGRGTIVVDPETKDLKLSAREIIEAVLPIIEGLAGPNSSSAPDSAMIAAVVAVVRAATTEAKPKDKKIKAAGTAARKKLNAERAAEIVRELQRRRPIR